LSAHINIALVQNRGKLLGGAIGLIAGLLLRGALGGGLGFMIGSLLGHFLLDVPLRDGVHHAERAFRRRQGELLFHVFRMCAKIAKSDGRVNNAEISLMERLMRQHFRLSDDGRAQAVRIWKAAKDSSDSFEQYAYAFYRDFARDRYQVLNTLDILFAVAAADGRLHPREEELLLRAAGIFQVSRSQFERIKARYYAPPPRQQEPRTALAAYYAVLGAAPQDSLEEIKKKFRNLAKQWHPDRLTAKGASPDAVQRAKEKFQQINEAYERISAARKKG